MQDQNKSKRRFPRLLAALLSVAGLAGCVGDDATDSQTGLAPVARLEVDRDSRFAGEAFTFDAQGSEDPNGNITKWVFDFGDGETLEVTSEDEARVKHRYDLGGVYNVTLTVVDDGTDQDGPLNTTETMQVVVDERYALGPILLAAAPDNASATARFEHTLSLNETAERFELEVTFTNQALIASSRVHLRVVGPDNETVVEETVELDPNENETVDFDERLTKSGTYTLTAVAESGATDATGELRIFHAA